MFILNIYQVYYNATGVLYLCIWFLHNDKNYCQYVFEYHYLLLFILYKDSLIFTTKIMKQGFLGRLTTPKNFI